MVCLDIADEGDHLMAGHDWKVAEYMQYKQSRIAYKRESSTSNVGLSASNFPSYKSSMLRNVTQSLG
jgi:hypothetical protein